MPPSMGVRDASMNLPCARNSSHSGRISARNISSNCPAWSSRNFRMMASVWVILPPLAEHPRVSTPLVGALRCYPARLAAGSAGCGPPAADRSTTWAAGIPFSGGYPGYQSERQLIRQKANQRFGQDRHAAARETQASTSSRAFSSLASSVERGRHGEIRSDPAERALSDPAAPACERHELDRHRVFPRHRDDLQFARDHPTQAPSAATRVGALNEAAPA